MNKNLLKEIKYLNLKDFTFHKYICNCILWQIFNEIVEHQDFYIGIKTTFKKNVNEKFIFLF